MLVHPNTSARFCQYDYIKNDQLVFEGLAKLLIETDTWAFHKRYVYKLQEVNQLGNSNECFFLKKIHQMQNKKQDWISKEIPPYYILKSSQFPLPGCFTFKQHQSSHGRQKSITYVYIYIHLFIYVDKNKIK